MSENIAKYNVILELLANTQGIDETQKKMGGLQKTFSVAKGAFAGIIGAAVVQSAISAIGGLVSKTIQLSTSYEQTKIAFDTFLGDSEKATQVLSDLNKFSIETPFEPEQVNQAGKALLAFGFNAEDLIPKLTQIGDISAATGKDFNELATIFGKAKVAGTLFAEDINQLTEAGIPVIQEFAKQLGVSEGQVKKLASEGKLSFKNLEEAFSSLTSEGGKFQGLMLAQSQSFGGLISSLKGVFDELLRGFGDALLPILKTLLIPLTNGLFALQDAFKKIQPVVSGFFKGLFTFLGNTLRPLIESWKGLAVTLYGAGKGFESLKVIINGLSGIFRIIVQSLTFFIDALNYVFKFLQTSNFPFMVQIRKEFGQLVFVFENLSPILSGTIAAVKQAGSNIVDFFTLTTLQAKKIISDFQAFLGSDSAGAESKRLAQRISKIKSESKTIEEAFTEAFNNEKENRIKIEGLDAKEETKRKVGDEKLKAAAAAKAAADARKKLNEENEKKKSESIKKEEALNKRLFELSQERVNKNFAILESEKRKTIKDEDDLSKELEKIELNRQIALLIIKQQYSKVDSSEFIEIGNAIDELDRKYNNLFTRAKVDPIDLLPNESVFRVQKQVDILRSELEKLNKSFSEVADPRIKDEIRSKIEAIVKEIQAFNSPKINKLTFETGGFEAIGLESLLPTDRIPALQSRLGLVAGSVEQLKAKLQAGLGDPLDLQAFDSLQEEGEKIIELLRRLGIKIPAMSKKIIEGTGDILGISPASLKLMNESVEVARDAFSTISDIYTAELDTRIAAQESRVSDAEKIAEKGNVRQLQIEEERLAKLTDERQKAAERASIIEKAAAQAQIIINTALTISSLQVAAAGVAAKTTVAAPITVPVILAIVGGLIASAANLFKPPSFKDGIDYFSTKKDGRVTGPGNGRSDSVPAWLSNGERVVDAITNEQIKDFPNSKLPDAVRYYQMRPTALPVIAMGASKDNSEMLAKLDGLKESFEALRINVSLDQKGFVAEIDRLQQKRIDRKRYTA